VVFWGKACGPTSLYEAGNNPRCQTTDQANCTKLASPFADATSRKKEVDSAQDEEGRDSKVQPKVTKVLLAADLAVEPM
jgi:hypothetical protein